MGVNVFCVLRSVRPYVPPLRLLTFTFHCIPLYRVPYFLGTLDDRKKHGSDHNIFSRSSGWAGSCLGNRKLLTKINEKVRQLKTSGLTRKYQAVLRNGRLRFVWCETRAIFDTSVTVWRQERAFAHTRRFKMHNDRAHQPSPKHHGRDASPSGHKSHLCL